MSFNKLNKAVVLSVLLISGLIFTGCSKDDNDSDGVSVEKYNTLVDKHNTLLENSNSKYNNLNKAYRETINQNDNLSSKYNQLVEDSNDTKNKAWEASNKFIEYIKATESMNNVLATFATNVAMYIKFSDRDKKNYYNTLKEQYETGTRRILEVQKLLIEQYNELYQLAPNIYKKETSYLDSLDMQNRKSKLVFGIENQHNVLMDIVNKHFQNIGGSTQKQIVLTQSETKVGQASKGSGLFVKSDGSTTTYTPSQFKAEAQRLGFELPLTEDSQEMASSMNGVVGMACTNKNLISVLNNLVSHMKTKANLNSDDLEIALAIDYSGSMSNNIAQVLTELSTFVSSLANVKSAGREVKIGISTFGNVGMEKIELDLNSNINDVQQSLARLLDNFNQDSHSTDPGEASYYGLAETSKLSWNSQNRQAIVITDEASYSLQMGDTSFVKSVINKMANINVYPLMVKICD